MSSTPTEPGHPPAPPRGVAISGIVFSALYFASLVLLRLAVPADPTESGAWLGDPVFRNRLDISLNLVPFAGIAFLWYMAAIRDHVGLREDRFFRTVFLGSGLLFVAMLFTAGAVSQGLLGAFGTGPQSPGEGETYAVGRRLAYTLMATFGTRMAAVFMFVTSTIGLRTKVLPRWVSFVGFAFGLVLLLIIAEFAWVMLLFPCWVLLVSTWILIADHHKERQPSRREGGELPATEHSGVKS